MSNIATVLPVLDLEHLTTSIVGTTTYEDYVTYEVRVECRDLAWVVSRRFSEFQELYDALSEYCTSLPQPPEKTFLRQFHPSFVSERRTKLEEFLKAILRVPYARNSRHLITFLEVQKHFRPDTSKFPRIYQTIVDRNFGANDVVYSAEDGFLLVACEDVAVLSKIETKLGYFGSFLASLASHGNESTNPEGMDPTSLALPRLESVVEPTDQDTLICGLVTCWVRDPHQDSWSHISTVCFSSPAACITWDRNRRCAYVGLENGRVIVLQANEDLKRLIPIKELALHTDRYAGLIYVEKHDSLLAASRDRRVSVYNLDEQKLTGRSLFNDPKFASLAIDPSTEYVYVGGFDSALYVYTVDFRTGELRENSTSQFSQPLPLSLTKTYSNIHKGCIRALSTDIAMSKNGPRTLMLTGSFDYSALLLELPTNKSQLSLSPVILATFQGGVPSSVKAVALCVSVNTVVTGHDDGSIMFWDIRTGLPEFHSQAHANSVVYLKYLQASNTVISAGRDGKIHFWLISNQTPIQRLSQTKRESEPGLTASSSHGQVPVVPLSPARVISSLVGDEEFKTPLQAEAEPVIEAKSGNKSEVRVSPQNATESKATTDTSQENPAAGAVTSLSHIDDGLIDLKLNNDEFEDIGMKFAE